MKSTMAFGLVGILSCLRYILFHPLIISFEMRKYSRTGVEIVLPEKITGSLGDSFLDGELWYDIELVLLY